MLFAIEQPFVEPNGEGVRACQELSPDQRAAFTVQAQCDQIGLVEPATETLHPACGVCRRR
jgi:hypothetical protein